MAQGDRETPGHLKQTLMRAPWRRAMIRGFADRAERKGDWWLRRSSACGAG
jgi:hypothetical protein